MISNEAVGGRVKACRQEQGLTLKAIEKIAGVSATHISEIERGKTSPTIGALTKIADALGKDVTFFLESEQLEDVCHLRVEERDDRPLPWGGGRFWPLTLRVPGGSMSAFEIELLPNFQSPLVHLEGNDIYLVRKGSASFTVDGERHDLNVGDSIHLDDQCAYQYESKSRGGCVLFLFSSTRVSLDEMVAEG